MLGLPKGAGFSRRLAICSVLCSLTSAIQGLGWSRLVSALHQLGPLSLQSICLKTSECGMFKVMRSLIPSLEKTGAQGLRSKTAKRSQHLRDLTLINSQATRTLRLMLVSGCTLKLATGLIQTICL